MTSRTVLVTGGGGLLGSHILPMLPNVIAPTRRELDLSRPVDSTKLPVKLDAVVYLAQSDRFRDFPDGAKDIFAVNCAGPAAMLDFARRAGATQFVLASSGSVYAAKNGSLSEDDPAEATNFYAASKLCAETLALQYSSWFNVVILRPFFIYGSGQSPDMLIPRLVAQVQSGGEVTLDGDDGLSLNPVHAVDAARAFVAALDLDRSAIVNVAGPEVMTIGQIARGIGEACGSEPNFVKSGEPERSLVGDIAAMRAHLGTPTTRIGDAVAELGR